MNNKGQTLVVFIVFIPLILLIFGIVVDLGLLSVEKRHISNTLKDTINYGLKHDCNDFELKELVNKNIDDCEVLIDNNETIIKIKVTKKYKSVFILLDKDITISYSGNKNSKEIIRE